MPTLKSNNDLGVALAQYLAQQDGVIKVRANRAAASITAQHEPNAWDSLSILMMVRAYRPDLTVLGERQASDSITDDSAHAGPGRQKLELALAGSALVLSLAIGPAAAPLAYGLLWFSSLSIFQACPADALG